VIANGAVNRAFDMQTMAMNEAAGTSGRIAGKGEGTTAQAIHKGGPHSTHNCRYRRDYNEIKVIGIKKRLRWRLITGSYVISWPQEDPARRSFDPGNNRRPLFMIRCNLCNLPSPSPSHPLLLLLLFLLHLTVKCGIIGSWSDTPSSIGFRIRCGHYHTITWTVNWNDYFAGPLRDEDSRAM